MEIQERIITLILALQKGKKKQLSSCYPPAAECQQFERKQSNRIALKQTLTRQENSAGYDTELLPTIHLPLQVV